MSLKPTQYAICNVSAIKDLRSPQSARAVAETQFTFLLKEKITQAQMPVCGKESEQDGAWENFRGTSFLESGFLFSLSEAM